MLAIALAVLVQAAVPARQPFEITSNKPFVPVRVGDSEPLWFIFDTGNNGNSLLARECAERLQLRKTEETRADVGAGSGADVRLSRLEQPMTLHALGETLTVAEPTLMTLAQVSKIEGRRVDGLIGVDFFDRHVIEIDYATRTMAIHDPDTYTPPAGATVLPVSLETGWPVVRGSITPRGGRSIPCDLLVDTGVRGVVTMFRPFSERHGLYGRSGNLRDVVTGGGAGGVSRGDVGRLDAMNLGALAFAKPVATFSRDTRGIFAIDGPDGILGGEILKRHRVTFDYPHHRMILEPYGGPATPFEYDMSGLFLAADAPDYAKIRIQSVNPKTPAEKAGLQKDDEIVSIDGQVTPALTLDAARAMLRTPAVRRLEVRRGEKVMQVKLESKRLV